MVGLAALFISLQSFAADTTAYVFVGTYTGGKSEGIYVYKFDYRTGVATPVNVARNISNPSYLAISRNKKYVYAVNEDAGKPGGMAATLYFNSFAGSLDVVNKVPLEADHPCYIAVNNRNTKAFTANYSSGSLSVLDIDPASGRLEKTTQVIRHAGKSQHPSRQENPHVHSTIFSPDEKFLFVDDLGTDEVKAYPFNEKAGVLDSNALTLKLPAGSGPRHTAFNLKKDLAYVVNELNATISIIAYNKKGLTLVKTVPIIEHPGTDDAGSADIHVSPDNRFLYVTTRGKFNEIAIFSIDKEGGLQYISAQSVLGNKPRNFYMDETGNYLLVGNENSASITIFRRNLLTGALTDTGNRIAVDKPACIQMALFVK